MKTQSPPGSRLGRLWNLEGWGLRWKVTAVVALPITVATVLGGLQVRDALGTASDFGKAAKQTEIVAPMLDMDIATGFAVANHLSRQGSPAEDAARVDESIRKVRETIADSGLDAELVASVERVIDETEALGSEMTTLSLDELGARTAAIQEAAANTVVAAIAPIGDEVIVEEVNRLVDAWASQRRLFDQTLAVIKRYQDPKSPDTALVSAIGSELAMIDVLARYFPADDPDLNGLRQAVDTRLDLMLGTPAGTPPRPEMHQTMLDSQQIYTPMIKRSTESIIDLVSAKADETRAAALRAAAVVLVTLLATIVLGILVAGSLVRPIRRLRQATLDVADMDLPDAIERIKVGDGSAVTDFEPIPVHTTEEIGQLARAVDDMHGQALRLAGEQAHLRLQVGDMFETLARRSKSLVDQQLGLIENLEFEEKDPQRLESLFRLDHLAARMRRNGDNLLILSGNRIRRGHSAPVQVGDTVRAAMSEVEEYQRVQVGSTPQGALSGAVAADVVHLLAELLDNALRASPPDSRVRISFARASDGGMFLEIADSGIGLPADRFAEINARLASGGSVGPETARHMGLFVVSRLAARHGLTVHLRPTHASPPDQGVTASVHVPDSLLVSPLEMPQTGPVPRVDTNGLPQVTVVPTGGMPQLVTVPARPASEPASHPSAQLPQRTPGAVVLPRRTPGASDLPRRTPEADVPPRPASAPAVSAFESPVPAPAAPAFESPVPAEPPRRESVDGPSSARRHRYLSNSAKTASFFQARPNITESQEVTTSGTPIFSGMVTDWLTDPTESGSLGKFEWASAADQGWSAAQRAGEAPVEARTESGLPQRSPGHRLVPGGVDVGGRRRATLARLRDPDAVRENLSRHQKGTREGRAASAAERAGIIGGDA
ncbi:ATP-binding protein [Prescottella defluvii]|uniref:ATP-binding protein n=1 Tax=Prescottella defluvii TaxID=1323361 RepID=UPI0004F2D390|nr:ATP-binding protein [Prescottella defluvii]